MIRAWILSFEHWEGCEFCLMHRGHSSRSSSNNQFTFCCQQNKIFNLRSLAITLLLCWSRQQESPSGMPHHVRIWELDHKESWVPKKWCFPITLLEKILESVLDSKDSKVKPVHPKGNQPWIFIGRTDAEIETPILWPPDEKNWLGKVFDARKDWRLEEKGTTEDEMAGWHHLTWWTGV